MIFFSVSFLPHTGVFYIGFVYSYILSQSCFLLTQAGFHTQTFLQCFFHSHRLFLTVLFSFTQALSYTCFFTYTDVVLQCFFHSHRLCFTLLFFLTQADVPRVTGVLRTVRRSEMETISHVSPVIVSTPHTSSYTLTALTVRYIPWEPKGYIPYISDILSKTRIIFIKCYLLSQNETNKRLTESNRRDLSEWDY